MTGTRRPNRLSGLVTVRDFHERDAESCHRVFYDAVHQGARDFYTEIERIAWAPHDSPSDRWAGRLADNKTMVAAAERRILGFMSLTLEGHLDLAFVTPQAMGTGIAGRLYAKLESWAIQNGLAVLTTDASHLAKRFFTRQGWDILAQQSVISNGHPIVNFRMEKRLNRKN